MVVFVTAHNRIVPVPVGDCLLLIVRHAIHYP